MKGILAVLVMMLLCRALHAQDLKVTEFKNEPVAIKSDSSLQRLEFTHYEVTLHTDDGYGLGGTAIDYVLSDYSKSPVRLQTHAEFMVKLTDVEIDPESVFLLTKVYTDKKGRIIYTTGNMGRGAASLKVKIEFIKIAPGLYRIRPEKLLPKTEYSFVTIPDNGQKTRCFLFGVD